MSPEETKITDWEMVPLPAELDAIIMAESDPVEPKPKAGSRVALLLGQLSATTMRLKVLTLRDRQAEVDDSEQDDTMTWWKGPGANNPSQARDPSYGPDFWAMIQYSFPCVYFPSAGLSPPGTGTERWTYAEVIISMGSLQQSERIPWREYLEEHYYLDVILPHVNRYGAPVFPPGKTWTRQLGIARMKPSEPDGDGGCAVWHVSIALGSRDREYLAGLSRDEVARLCKFDNLATIFGTTNPESPDDKVFYVSGRTGKTPKYEALGNDTSLSSLIEKGMWRPWDSKRDSSVADLLKIDDPWLRRQVNDHFLRQVNEY